MIVWWIQKNRNTWNPAGSGDTLKSNTKGASDRQPQLRIKQHKITGSSFARGQALGKTHYLISTSWLLPAIKNIIISFAVTYPHSMSLIIIFCIIPPI